MQLHTTLEQFRAAALVSLAVFVASAGMSLAQDAVTPPPTGADPEGVETLTRGPVHEAFAAPTANDPKPNAVVPKKPPADIDEVQPDYRPDGAIWVNGYWEWDEETKDFIWISGLWRVPPPEMRWVPPYWTEVDGGWQRVSGFWISTSAGELEYRVPPPNSLEVGPSSPAPADNYFYIPGTWTYYDTGYRWRSGYWSPYREDWVWCPARWIWTPAGCLYQSGYWDYRPLVRAQCYAPVRFTSAVYLTPGYVYRPWCVVDSSRFFVHLWIGPRANCYYFGNYYGSYATTFGFTPWCSWSYHSRSCYDPLWSWCHTHYRRQGIDYIGRCKGWHDHFDHHEHERPARTWNEQVRMVADAKLDPRKSQNVLAADLADVVKRDDLPIKLTKLDDRQRASIVKVSDDMRKLNVERLKTEREAHLARTGDGDDHGKPNNKAGETKPGDNKVADNNPTDNKVGDIKTSDKPGNDKPGDSKLEGNKSVAGRSGRLPRIDSARSAGDDKAVAAAKSGETPTGDDKPGDDKPGDAKPGSDKSAGDKPEASKTARLDALSNSLSSKGGEGKRTARLKLPEQTEAIREVTRNTRVTARGRDSTSSTGLKETAIELPNQAANRTGSSDLDRGNKLPKTGSSAGSVDLGTSTIRNRGNGRAGTSSPGITGSNIPGNSIPGNSATGNSVSGTSGPDIKPPKADRSGNTTTGSSGQNTNAGGNNSRSRRLSDGPTIELPKISSPGGDAPKIESPKIQSQSNRSGEIESRGSSRGSQPRIESPKFDAPKIDAPKIDGPKFDAPKIESRGNRASDNSIRSGQSRIALPASSGGSSGPKIELGTSRSGGGQPRVDSSKFSAPKIDVPRASPRIEMPRSSPSNNFQSRSMSRSEGQRSSSSNSGGGNSRSRGRDRD
jgi:hypothetical protein